MNSYSLSLSFASTINSLTEQQETDRILACNEKLKTHGLFLTGQQALGPLSS